MFGEVVGFPTPSRPASAAEECLPGWRRWVRSEGNPHLARSRRRAPKKESFRHVVQRFLTATVVSWPADGSLAAQAQPSLWSSLVPLLLIMLIFYLLLILPAQRRQKKLQEMLRALKAGDRVITQGGIYGTIVALEEQAVQLRITDQVKIKVARAAIAQVLPEKEAS